MSRFKIITTCVICENPDCGREPREPACWQGVLDWYDYYAPHRRIEDYNYGAYDIAAMMFNDGFDVEEIIEITNAFHHNSSKVAPDPNSKWERLLRNGTTLRILKEWKMVDKGVV